MKSLGGLLGLRKSQRGEVRFSPACILEIKKSTLTDIFSSPISCGNLVSLLIACLFYFFSCHCRWRRGGAQDAKAQYLIRRQSRDHDHNRKIRPQQGDYGAKIAAHDHPG